MSPAWVNSAAILRGRSVVQRVRVGLADVEQPVRDRIDDELVVAVGFLRLLGGRGVPGRLGLDGLGQELGVVGREEIELPLDELVEAPVPSEPHTTSP